MDTINYKNNLESFIENITNSFVRRISFDIDTNPTFDKKSIPFNFLYCNSIRITTDKDSFEIITSMTETTVETFWVISSEKTYHFSTDLLVNSKVKNVEFENGYCNLAFKIAMEFEKNKLFLYSADIHEKDENLDYKINDEMIVVIENEMDAETFETIISKRINIDKRKNGNR